MVKWLLLLVQCICITLVCGETLQQRMISSNWLTANLAPGTACANPGMLGWGNHGLSGPILPVFLKNCIQCTQMILHSQSLSGTLPTQFWYMTKLNRLEIGANKISGTIPTQMYQNTAMTYIYYSINKFYGTIPTQVCLWTNLKLIGFTSSTKLSGTIPVCLATLPSLATLYLEDLPQLTFDISDPVGAAAIEAKCNVPCPHPIVAPTPLLVPTPVSTPAPTPVPNTDCVVTWGSWNSCYPACHSTRAGLQSRTFTVTTPQSGSGAACPTGPESQTCSVPDCQCDPACNTLLQMCTGVNCVDLPSPPTPIGGVAVIEDDSLFTMAAFGVGAFAVVSVTVLAIFKGSKKYKESKVRNSLRKSELGENGRKLSLRQRASSVSKSLKSAMNIKSGATVDEYMERRRQSIANANAMLKGGDDSDKTDDSEDRRVDRELNRQAKEMKKKAKADLRLARRQLGEDIHGGDDTSSSDNDSLGSLG